jgi:hypothetical protein
MVLREVVERLYKVLGPHSPDACVCGVRCLYFSCRKRGELIDDSGDRMYLVHAHAHGNDLLEREYHGRIPYRLRVRE